MLTVHGAEAVAVGADDVAEADCVAVALDDPVLDVIALAFTDAVDVAGWLDALVWLPGAEQPISSAAAMTATRVGCPFMALILSRIGQVGDGTRMPSAAS